jgi:hypothetical protein
MKNILELYTFGDFSLVKETILFPLWGAYHHSNRSSCEFEVV